ncbi:hypothetical protein ACFOYW_01665 [Gryllotalpicola reticulitermitis]|uniref:Mannosyltransferase n=1 Tax=Gryllotalpicola reticulitermitis TaxID=1184153 RepID=A0ABV8Q108_9MICO
MSISRDPRLWPALAVGAFGFAVSFALSWIPSLDFNEAATVISALRPWPALWQEIHHVDAVHASYYAFMHLWFDLVGYTPLTLRIPASIAAGVTAALLVVLGTRLAGRLHGVVAGLIFAVLPQSMWMGFEGRQYEASMALATGMVLVFLVAHRRTIHGERSWPWWCGYGLLSIVSQYIFGYLFMVDIGLAVLLVLPLLRRTTRSRAGLRSLGRFGLAVGCAVVAWVPLAVLEVHEQGQVSWITGITLGTADQVLVSQFFPGAPFFAVVGWLAAIAGGVAGVVAWRRGIRSPARRVASVALPWLLIPTTLLLVATAFGHHLYYPRYVAFSAPALALLIAVPFTWLWRLPVPALGRASLEWVRRRRQTVWTAVAIAAVFALVAPTWAAQRTPGSKEADAWNQIAAVITAERKEEPKGARNVVVFGAAHAHKVATSQVIGDLYPQAFRGMDDITLAQSYDRTHSLWDTSRPLDAVLSRTRGANYVWVLTTVQSHQAPADISMLAKVGFRVNERWQMNKEVVVQLVHAPKPV